MARARNGAGIRGLNNWGRRARRAPPVRVARASMGEETAGARRAGERRAKERRAGERRAGLGWEEVEGNLEEKLERKIEGVWREIGGEVEWSGMGQCGPIAIGARFSVQNTRQNGECGIGGDQDGLKKGKMGWGRRRRWARWRRRGRWRRWNEMGWKGNVNEDNSIADCRALETVWSAAQHRDLAVRSARTVSWREWGGKAKGVVEYRVGVIEFE